VDRFIGANKTVFRLRRKRKISSILNNQFYIQFQTMPGKKDGLQRVDISTSTLGADL
jgi:hypothetical protein